MTPVVYVGPSQAVTVGDGTVFPRNTPVDVDDDRAGLLLDRPDFRAPDGEFGSREEVSGDGSGEALPPVSDDAYPPDATPLDPLDDTADDDQEE